MPSPPRPEGHALSGLLGGRPLGLLQLVLAALTVAAAALHAFTQLTIDNTTVLLLVLAGVFLFLGIFQSLTVKLDKLEIDLQEREDQEKLREAELSARQAVLRTVQRWTSDMAGLQHALAQQPSPQDRLRVLVAYCRARLRDALLLVQPPDEQIRLSLWWYVPQQGTLRLLLSNDIGPADPAWRLAFRPGHGIVGWVYSTGRPYTTPDVTTDPLYRPLPGAAPTYRGVAAVPACAQGRVLGVVSMDRQRPQHADEVMLVVLQALGDTLAAALTSPYAEGLITATPPAAGAP